MDCEIRCSACNAELDGQWSHVARGTWFAEPCETCIAKAREEAVDEYKDAVS